MADILELIGDIKWYRGDSFPMGMRLKDKRTGEYIDLTGYEFLFTVNEEQDPTDATKQKFQVIGVVNPDQVTNKGWVTFTPEIDDTATLAIQDYYYDIQMKYSALRPRTIAKYKFKLSQDITK